jgi:septal ring factor EnvC (AmiA/AmiB activator)
MLRRATGWGLALAWAVSLAPALPAFAQKADLGTVVKQQIRTDADARASQERVNQLDDETQKLLSEYRKALADTESYNAYADQLGAQVQSQREEIEGVNAQLVEVERTAREVTPLMQKMLDTLAQFVALDVPFLVEERAKRVTGLQQMMARADVTISEKYRRILEAYQVEMDYGRTIEAYEAKLGDGDGARTVQFLRVGRVSLLYQTLDGRETGYWDAQKKAWTIDDEYQYSFKQGVAVAKKLSAPEMLVVPVPAPRDVKS